MGVVDYPLHLAIPLFQPLAAVAFHPLRPANRVSTACPEVPRRSLRALMILRRAGNRKQKNL